VATACLALLASALAVGLVRERELRLALSRQLESRPAPPAAPSPVPAAPSGPLASALPPDSYLVVRRALEQDPDAWPEPTAADPTPTVPTSPVILRACDRDAFLEP
jgi:hypothetical protein